ncbi:MAG TPA: GntR family transcriptional regulator [Nocardioides sp.]|jgi:GntR family transcriptional repressor for pyruvate dehydrogenase complex|uniref:FadR/GntR family transcriptional regulator n=1 Tax=Nocardioides sp. TaxID=35761 RepID=UPI002E300048|nr:GntR family transcriptional regulator [Nocardioides sp.]HEX3929861.1 GntR family transcriptional regulator [Nocardioides sp.]
MASRNPVGPVQLRIPKAAELIAAHLRQRIVSDDLSEEDPLPPESNLMQQFSVSRPTLREAYRILESEGLITVRRGAHGGARVHKPRPDVAARYAAHVLQSQGARLKDVFDAREVLEGAAIDLLGPKPSKAGLERLREINLRGQDLEHDLLTALEIHHEFHRALVDMAGNLTVSLLRNMIDIILEAATERHVANAGGNEEQVSSRKAQRTHVKLVELMEQGDLPAAGRLWRAHLSDSAKIVLATANSALDVTI